jgi:uncharacterized protein YyaL (SSP411 family)
MRMIGIQMSLAWTIWLVAVTSAWADPPAAAPQSSEPPKHTNAPKSGQPPKHTNRLAKESSPYLLQHAHNPVDWFPWGPEAFEKAKREKKLIFLSIGYSSCHWCHVMERESFANEEVAKLLNANFVCIKVDREERPDIDEIYMTALTLLNQSGGWPLSMFLLPDGRPVVGGTYWPREDREIDGQKIKGFKSILTLVADIYQREPEQVEDTARRLTNATIAAMSSFEPEPVELNRALVEGVVADLTKQYDAEYGGFGRKGPRVTRFPMPARLTFLIAQARRPGGEALVPMIEKTLDAMAHGGIYDHLGGGFHRYSTDRTWTVPHFEKMLYDNAQLIEVYADALTLLPHERYKRIVRQTIDFVEREMTDPAGGFYAALDADSEGEEGKFYVWTPAEIDRVLADPKDRELFKAIYLSEQAPNFEGKAYVLRLAGPLADSARQRQMTEQALEQQLSRMRLSLLRARENRPRPFLDKKVLTAWNGQMIAALARAGQALNEPRYLDLARRAADFVLDKLRTKDGRLLRSWAAAPGQAPTARLKGYLDDYAFLTHGLLNLHAATQQKRYLDEAVALMASTRRHFSDHKLGGFFFTADDHEQLFVRAKDQFDGAQPSGNSMTVCNLVRLYQLTKQPEYLDVAKRSLGLFAASLRDNPSGLALMGHGLSQYLDLTEAAKTGLKDVPKVGGAGKGKRSDDKVKASVKVEPVAGNTRTLNLTLEIEKGWHIYANPIGNEMLAGNETTVTILAGGKAVPAKLNFPKGKIERDPMLGDYGIYSGTITITAEVMVGGPLEVRIRVNACRDGEGGVCLPPGTVTLKVE